MIKQFCDICEQQIKSDPITWERKQVFDMNAESSHMNYDVCNSCDARIQKLLKNLEIKDD